MGRVLLVTGTDTGVGKTIVAAWLAKTIASRERVALVKAIQAGAEPLVDGDEAQYRALAKGVATYTLASFAEPLAPSIAARRAGQKVTSGDLVKRCKAIAAKFDVTIVEGSGGLLVPIADGYDFGDFATALKASLVVVLRPGLGTLNHTLLTIEAAQRRSLPIEAHVCCGLDAKPRVVEIENLRYLHERFPKTPLLALHKATPRQLVRLELQPRHLGPLPDYLNNASIVPMDIAQSLAEAT
ncbi:MAG: dethiobiotin synthase [Chloroflexi bacterium]|nr:dethiobiotin synthase [Chloroflexota bacterium]